MDKIEFKNGSVIESIGNIKSNIRSKRGDEQLRDLISQEKNLYLVSYRYKLTIYDLEQEWEYDNFVIKAKDNKSVHGYLDKFRQEFISCGYEMEYSFQQVGEGNSVEI